MAVKIYKPKTPGQRHRTGYTFEEITKDRPERSLIVSGKKKAGRNSLGRITVRHRGGVVWKRRCAWHFATSPHSRPRRARLGV